MTNSQRSVCIFGGTGFVGRQLTRLFVKAGDQVTIVTRQASRHKDLRISPQIELRDVDIYDDERLLKTLKGHDVAVNLVGILNERPSRGETFERVHHYLPGRIAAACSAVGVERLLHMSSLKASEDGPSEYLKSKARGMQAMIDAAGNEVDWTVFQPSVIFGDRDGFTRLFANLLRKSPFLPLACPDAQFQPVFIDDVVTAMSRSLDLPATVGQTYELGGPNQYSLHELVKAIAEMANTHQRILRLNDTLSRLQANVMQFVPGKPFTPDNYQSMQVDSVCNGPFPEVFGIEPTALESVGRQWLSPSDTVRRAKRYDKFRRAAGR